MNFPLHPTTIVLHPTVKHNNPAHAFRKKLVDKFHAFCETKKAGITPAFNPSTANLSSLTSDHLPA